jgi:F420-0:gamma-glutamyl ligase
MNFKVLTIATLLLSTVCFSVGSVAEKMPESDKFKEQRIENDLNDLFTRGMNAAALILGKKEDLHPFAIIKKYDGTLGMFELDNSEKTKGLSVNQKALSIRRYLTELAIAKQIEATVLVMYAVIQPKGKEPRQGITFEMEHIEGISFMRFLPTSNYVDEKDASNNKLVLNTEAISDVAKPVTVFTNMVKAIVKQKQ